MGAKQDKFLSQIKKISSDDFEYIQAIGKGAFGKVWSVSLKGRDITFALKKMYKPKIYDKNCVDLIFFEKDILEKMYHPFIANSYIAFQDNDYIYIIMDLLSGGDLRYHLYKNKFFPEQEVKFFLACTILGLEYLHKNNLIHHDLKPENLLIDEKGYISIVDFGIAKFYRTENCEDISGSPGYIAPEILNEENHGFEVDYYSLGIIAYELLFGERPFKGLRRKELKNEIAQKEIKLKKIDFLLEGTDEMADFINKLLKRNKNERLGHNGFEEIKSHPLFKYFNWKDLYLKKLRAPFLPSKNLKDNFNFSYCNTPDKVDSKAEERYKEIVKTRLYKDCFTKYKFFNRFALMNKKTKDAFINPHCIYEILEEKERAAFDPDFEEGKNANTKIKRSSSMKNFDYNTKTKYSFTPEIGVKKANLNFRLFSPAPVRRYPSPGNLAGSYNTNIHVFKNNFGTTERKYDLNNIDKQLDIQSDRNFKLESLKMNLKDKFNDQPFVLEKQEKEKKGIGGIASSIFQNISRVANSNKVKKTKHNYNYMSNNIFNNDIKEDNVPPIFNRLSSKKEDNAPPIFNRLSSKKDDNNTPIINKLSNNKEENNNAPIFNKLSSNRAKKQYREREHEENNKMEDFGEGKKVRKNSIKRVNHFKDKMDDN